MKKVKKYIKMLIPRFGTFTNGAYKIKGIMFLGSLYGKVVESYYPMVYEVGEFVSLPEYHLSGDDEPQFY
jgi:hypothetical protein